MADRYIWSGAAGSGSGADWNNAFTTLLASITGAAAGDRFLVAHDHAETTSGNIVLTFPGTQASPSIVQCVNRVTGNAASSAVIASTGSSLIDLNGFIFVDGVQISAGSGSTNGHGRFGQLNSYKQVYRNIFAAANTTNSAVHPQIGANNSVLFGSVVIENSVFKFSNAAQGVTCVNADIEVIGCSLDVSSAAPGTCLFRSPTNGREPSLMISGCDFSNAAVGVAIFQNNGLGRPVIRNSKLPNGWTGKLVLSGALGAGYRAEMHNCTAGAVLYEYLAVDYSGTIRDEKTIVKSGSSSFGSLKMASSANASYPLTTLISPEINKYNTSTIEITATVEIVTDSATGLKDDEIWLEVSYPGTSGQTVVTDGKASILATAADQASSAVDWTTTGLSTPFKQKLSVTFTPGAAGWLQAKVKLAKPSTTVYVDPVLTVA